MVGIAEVGGGGGERRRCRAPDEAEHLAGRRVDHLRNRRQQSRHVQREAGDWQAGRQRRERRRPARKGGELAAAVHRRGKSEEGAGGTAVGSLDGRVHKRHDAQGEAACVSIHGRPRLLEQRDVRVGPGKDGRCPVGDGGRDGSVSRRCRRLNLHQGHQRVEHVVDGRHGRRATGTGLRDDGKVGTDAGDTHVRRQRCVRRVR
mmetsp:Transcript_7566/g.24220  ORF Transcript_7566/g.24220 Transcript_7566/m.24220 type:complete len:203 (-) Transcript_7566:19-627(-)